MHDTHLLPDLDSWILVEEDSITDEQFFVQHFWRKSMIIFPGVPISWQGK